MGDEVAAFEDAPANDEAESAPLTPTGDKVVTFEEAPAATGNLFKVNLEETADSVGLFPLPFLFSDASLFINVIVLRSHPVVILKAPPYAPTP